MNLGMLEQVFVLHLCKKSSEETYSDLNQGITNDKIRNFAQTLKEYFAECDYPAITSCYGDRIIGFMKNCTDDRRKN